MCDGVPHSQARHTPKHATFLKTMSEQTTTPADVNHPHSIFGASGAKRWRTCPGSVNIIQKAKALGEIPQREESEFASEGTEAHDWSDKVLTGKCGIEEVPDTFREHLDGYIDLCQRISRNAEKLGGTVYHEATVPLFYRPEDEGTMDFAAVTSEWIQVVDLKYGIGVEVTAEMNEQLAIYFLSLVAKLEAESGEKFPDDLPVALAIYQPRHRNFAGEPDVWNTTMRDLKDYGIDIEADYKVALTATDAQVNPTREGCQFCDAKGVCAGRAKQFLDPMVDFQDETAPTLTMDARDTLTPEQIEFLCINGKAIKKLVDDVAKGEHARIIAGGELHRMKLVGGKLGNRKWVDEKAAETFLKGQLSVEERYAPRKVITAPQALAKLKGKAEDLSTIAKAKLGLLDDEAAKKSKTQCLIHRAEGSPTLVHIDDKREALDFSPVEDDFSEEVDTGDSELDDMM